MDEITGYEFNEDGSTKFPGPAEIDFGRIEATIKPERMGFGEIIHDIEKGRLVIPAFQRDFVWGMKESLDLLDSIYRGYPIGSFLIWETKKEMAYVKRIGNYKLNEPSEEGGLLSYILDGQQRIASIYACLKGIKIENRGSYCVYFDLDKKEFVEDSGVEEGRYVRFSEVFGKNHLAIMRGLTPERQYVFERLYQSFVGYNFSVIKIKGQPIDIVCEIFERINNTGRKLTVVDLLVAKTWDDEFKLRDKLKEYSEQLKEKHFGGIDERNILQCISVHNFKKCHRRDILRLDKQTLKDCWQRSIDSISLTIDFIKNEFNIKDSRILPFSLLIIPISYFFYKNNFKTSNLIQKEHISKWFWKASLSNRFDSGIDTKIAEDIKEFDKILSNEEPVFNYQYAVSKDRIKYQKFSTGSAFCKTILSLFAYLRPKNFKNDIEVDVNSSFSKYNQKEMHHFFPKDYLLQEGFDIGEINSVVNICFIPSNLNRELSDETPKDYIKELKQNNQNIKDTLKTHLIDIDAFGIEENDFNRFLDERATNIEKQLMVLAGLEQENKNESLITPNTPFSNKINFLNILKSCTNYIFWLDKYFSQKGLELLSECLNNESNNIKEVRIITSIDKVDEKFKGLFEDFKEEMFNKGIDCNLRVIVDSDLKSSIHDRFLISKNEAYNIPSPDIIIRNQLSEISKSKNKDWLINEFEHFWEKSKDIIDDWSVISNLKNKD